MRKPSSLGNLLDDAAGQFKRANLPTPDLDARLLLEHVASYSHAELISRRDDLVETDIVEAFRSCVDKRLVGTPVHRITGEREFYGRMLQLSDGTLIPRPDTEILVDVCLKLLSGYQRQVRVLEIGTGSGAIAVSLASEASDILISATDISQDALQTATSNAERLGVAEKIEFLLTDLFNGVEGSFDLIVSNPPYIPSSDIDELDREVREHDPIKALDGGLDGLDFYRAIFKDGKRHLQAGALIAVECGIEQASQLQKIAQAEGLKPVLVEKDLAGIERVFVASV